MSELDKMLAGEMYDSSDPELAALRVKARKLARKYNLTDEDEPEAQREILTELLPSASAIPALQAPIYFDYGCNTVFGQRCEVNFNFTCLDVCPVSIGDNAFIGPNVTIATPCTRLCPASAMPGSVRTVLPTRWSTPSRSRLNATVGLRPTSLFAAG